MGLGLAIFMNALEFREFDYRRGVRNTLKEALMLDVKKIRGTAKGFAIFGAMFSLFECMIEKQRKRHDSLNSFFGGGLTTTFLAMDTGMKWKGLMMTGLTGGLFGVVMEKLFEGIH